MKLKGKDFVMVLDGDAIAASRSCTLMINVETIETASPSSADWREYIIGRKDWSVSTEGLMIDSRFADDVALIGEKVYITFYAGSESGVAGWAIINKATFTGSVGEYATVQFELQGTGAIE